DKDVPKIALYRLWLGTDIEKLKCLTRASGDGTWGQLDGAYFLAEGDAKNLEAAFGKLKDKYGEPVFGRKGKKLSPIREKPMSEELRNKLKDLPMADKVSAK